MAGVESGQPFYKMTGSGNDFVVFDATATDVSQLENERTIRELSARGTGVGADGVVFLEAANGDVSIRYYNSDGSEADLCGNASLCSARLAVDLGLANAGGFTLTTGAGPLRARIRDGLPEIDLEPVEDFGPEAARITPRQGEKRIGYVRAGVPHLVVATEDLDGIDILGRGSELRHDESLADGANVNFVTSRGSDGWAYRTYERGVEAETLACGTGAVATAIMLNLWGESGAETTIWCRSGLPLLVTLKREGSKWMPSLRGEGRLVFEGRIRELD